MVVVSNPSSKKYGPSKKIGIDLIYIQNTVSKMHQRMQSPDKHSDSLKDGNKSLEPLKDTNLVSLENPK